jgi:hypothetical protein
MNREREYLSGYFFGYRQIVFIAQFQIIRLLMDGSRIVNNGTDAFGQQLLLQLFTGIFIFRRNFNGVLMEECLQCAAI